MHAFFFFFTVAGVKGDGSVAVVQGQRVLLDLDVAGRSVSVRLRVVGVDVNRIAVVLDGVGYRPRLEAPVTRVPLLVGGQGPQARRLAARTQHLHQVSQGERRMHRQRALPAARAELAPLQPLVQAVLAEGVPAGGLARPRQVLHADGTR